MSAARRSMVFLRPALACGTLLASAALALTAAVPAYADPAPPAPGGLTDSSLQGLLDRLQTLYAAAESATEDYNAAKEQLGRQREKVDQLSGKLAAQRAAVEQGRRQAGLLARRQYMDAGLSSYAKLLLTRDPDRAFEHGHFLVEAATSQAELIARLRADEKKLDSLTTKQKRSLTRIEKLVGEQRTARDQVGDKLTQVEEIVSTLTGAELKELQRLEERGIDASQAEFLRYNSLGTGSLAPSKAGLRAIAYAFHQLGDPYVWGAEGPGSFDCSGLTSQAWLHAGRVIPRTSQEQWKRLPRVPLNRLRPGDLVIYFPGATHVAMYIGNGMIVQAPRPGGHVKVSPIGAMPVKGAVRPDPEAKSARHYDLPDIPAKARKPTPIGSGKQTARGR